MIEAASAPGGSAEVVPEQPAPEAADHKALKGSKLAGAAVAWFEVKCTCQLEVLVDWPKSPSNPLLTDAMGCSAALHVWTHLAATRT